MLAVRAERVKIPGLELPALASVSLVEWLAAAGLAGVFLFVVADLWRAGSRRRRLRAQSLRATRGEDRAEELLRRRGFRIDGRQVSRRYELAVDGAKLSVLLRADFVVRRRGRRYVAEVKTGRLAPRIETSSTRRQLLEYRVAFGIDGVLLVDADSSRVSLVEFPLPTTVRSRTLLGWALAASLVVVGAHLFPDAGCNSSSPTMNRPPR